MAEHEAIFDVTDSFLMDNINFPPNSYVLYYTSIGFDDPILEPTGEITLSFSAGVTLSCGADSSPDLKQFFIDALESPAFLTALLPVLDGTAAESTDSVQLSVPPFLMGFGRL